MTKDASCPTSTRRHFLARALFFLPATFLLPFVENQRAKAQNTDTVPTPFGTPLPHDRDSCPVCGMFPARYPDWIATILYRDGHADHFDGAKDMFKYLLDMKKYAAGRKKEDILLIGVTDYYATRRIDARKALYVAGSDVLGPMGHELIPHPDHYDADEFMKDHHGKRLLTFDEITIPLLEALDRGEALPQ